MAVVLQVIGLVLISVGVFVWFGPGPAVVAAGVSAVVAGAFLEAERDA